MASPGKQTDWLAGTSTLKGPVLMLLLERPGHAYDVARRLSKRVGPAWAIKPGEVYPILERLEEKGMLTGRYEQHPDKPHQRIYVYHPTELAAGAALEWVANPVSCEPERSELLALFAVLREEHAPELLRRLDEYESDCFRAAKDIDAEIPTDTWMGMLMELARKAIVGRLQAEIDWAATARQWIQERQASRP